MLSYCGHADYRVSVVCRQCSIDFVRGIKNLSMNCLSCGTGLELGHVEKFDLVLIYCPKCDSYSILQGIKLEE